jgi:hypothetical protein
MSVAASAARSGRTFVDVLDHLLAPLVLEIHIDIRRFVALLRDEALEQHLHAGRVHGGDAEAVAHGGIGGRAAPLAEDAPRAGEAHDVVHGEEVGGVVHLADDGQLMGHQLPHLLRYALRPARPRPCPPGETFQIVRGRLPRRHVVHRVGVAQLVQGEAAASGDGHGLGQPGSGRYSRARSSRGRRCRSPLANNRDPASDSGTRWRMAVSTSCRARRSRRCMCTSPVATSGRPVRAERDCSSALRAASVPSRCRAMAIQARPGKTVCRKVDG